MEISISFTLDWRLIGVTLVALFAASLAYNSLVERLGHKKDGYTALLVAGGVLFTLAAVAVVCWQAALICLVAFGASGPAMILGDILRAIHRREQALHALKENHE